MAHYDLTSATTAPDFLYAPGEMAELIRSIDWSKTPLGPPAAWPQSLRTSLSICLHSHFPILLWWGPELVMLYNDAYRPMLGTSKHPAAMGMAGRKGWDDVWHIIGPMLEGVIKEGKATWSENQMLPLERYGYVEECFFTFSYSPISDESGGIGGVFCAVTETTQQIISARRLVILNDLAAHAGRARTQAQALALAADTLTRHPADLPFGLIYRLDSESNTAVLEAAINIEPGAALSPERIDLAEAEGEAIWPLAALAADAEKNYLLLENLGAAYASLPGGAWPEPSRQVLILPIQQEQQQHIYGFFIAGISPRRAFDEAYHGFLRLVADQLSSGLTRAAAYEYERKRAEALAEIDRAKTDFFANVSHEFRTPLTLMLAPLEEAFASAQPSLAGEDLGILYRNALRLLKLVNALLDFSRIEADRVKASYRPCDLASLTADLASMFRSAIEKAGLSFKLHCPPLAEPVYIDQDMWEKIVLNLLSNAFKFTFAGEIAVSLQQAGGAVELTVRDTGTGIAEEELPHLFTRFHRIKQARSRTHEGSGIGNALVKELVERHGGTIEVESSLGKGSTFRVRIPLGTQHLPQDQIERQNSLPAAGIRANAYVEEALRWLPDSFNEQITATGRAMAAAVSPFRCPEKAGDTGKKVLVVDDNADMRQYLVKLLQPCWQVEAVADGTAALQAAMAQPPDLVLTDIMMPQMDGLELVAHLRNHEKTKRIPIVIISARAGAEATIEGVETGADDYIVKPFSPRELMAKIATNLQLAELRREAEREITKNEKRLRAYIQTSSEIVYQMSPDWQEMRMLLGNDFLADTTQPTTAWLETYILPEDRAQVLADIQKAIRTKQLFKLEHRVRRMDGSLAWTHSRAVPILDENGEITEWIGTASDITERKKTEQELQENSARILSIMEKLPVGFAVLDPAGGITLRNTMMRRYIDVTMPSLDSQKLKQIKIFDGKGIALPPEQWPGPQALRGEAAYSLEGCFTGDDGAVEWHLLSSVPIHASDGKITGAVVVAQDITALKNTEQELRELNERLDSLVQKRTAAAEEKTEQLRSLTIQLIEAEENERRKFAELLHDDLQQIIGAAHVQVQTLAESLAEVPLLTDISDLLQNAITKTRYLSNEISPPVLYHADLAKGLQWLAARKKERFQLEVSIDIVKEPQISNISIKQFIFRAAQELLYNIVKHARTKRAHVRLMESANAIILEISDAGSGFDPAALHGAKAGFGLMTIQKRARYMGGMLDIESAPGRGSRFTLTLAKPDLPGGLLYGRRASDRVSAPLATVWENSPSSQRVLVVDDHHLMRRGLVNLLHSLSGIEVVGEAANGQEALDQTRKLHPDVVLMDISMPVIGGIEATKLLKKEFPAVRVIGLSMHQDPYIAEHMQSAGADATLTKTAGAAELIKAIQGKENEK